jgi:hypothetical protein
MINLLTTLPTFFLLFYSVACAQFTLPLTSHKIIPIIEESPSHNLANR